MSNNTPENKPPRTIDDAIDECQRIIFWHRVWSLIMVVVLGACIYVFYNAFKSQELTFNGVAEYLNAMGIQSKLGYRELDNGKGGTTRMPENYYETNALSAADSSKAHAYIGFMGLFIVTFGIIIAVYRFHLVEIARNEQIKLGFWRIRIAANNTEPGFQTEVRQALTKDAFAFDRTVKPEKGKKLESPVPGHPGSDLTTAFMNKILEHFEFVPKKGI